MFVSIEEEKQCNILLEKELIQFNGNIWLQLSRIADDVQKVIFFFATVLLSVL